MYPELPRRVVGPPDSDAVLLRGVQRHEVEQLVSSVEGTGGIVAAPAKEGRFRVNLDGVCSVRGRHAAVKSEEVDSAGKIDLDCRTSIGDESVNGNLLV
jgi:hypothetical protein